MGKIDKQLAKLEQFVNHIKKVVNTIKETQIKDIKEIEKHKKKVIKTIFSLEDMFDFDFTKDELKEDTLEDNIELLEELIDEIEQRYGLNEEKKEDEDWD